jgi:hypothetical protein
MPGQVLDLEDQTLMNGAVQQDDAVLVDLLSEVLAGNANST